MEERGNFLDKCTIDTNVSEYTLLTNAPSPHHKSSSITYDYLLMVFDNYHLFCVFPITPGSKTLPSPVGTWKILGAAIWPWFRYDEGMLNYGVRTENYYNLPPGPNNLVGILWMGLNKPGIGIHGTNNPETIGRAASHGCIRLANWDAARVKDLVSVGNTVIIF